MQDKYELYYYQQVYEDAKKEGIFDEAATPEKYEKLKKHPAVKKKESPNPIDAETVGVDSRNKVTPNWSEGKELLELDNLKKSLYELECKLSGPEGLKSEEENSDVLDKLDKLKKDIAELSDSLIPGGWKDTES